MATVSAPDKKIRPPVSAAAIDRRGSYHPVPGWPVSLGGAAVRTQSHSARQSLQFAHAVLRPFRPGFPRSVGQAIVPRLETIQFLTLHIERRGLANYKVVKVPGCRTPIHSYRRYTRSQWP